MNIVEAFLQQSELVDHGIAGSLSSVVLTPRFPASRHVVFLVMRRESSQPMMVAKVPRLIEISDSVEREVHNLRAIQALRPEGFESIPRVLAFERFHEYPILVETALVGQLMSPALVRRDPDRYCQAVISWLTELHQIRSPAVNWFEQIAERPVRYLEQLLPDEDQPLLAKLRIILRPLNDARLPLVVEHGDLSHPNLILMKTEKVGVVDWELSEVNGMAGTDLFFFLSYVAFSLSKANDTGDYITPFHSAFFGQDAWAVRYIRSYMEQIGIPSALLAPLFALCWTRYMSNLVMRLRVSNDGALQSATLVQLRDNRYYAIWRHTMLHIQELPFSVNPLPGLAD